MAHAAIPVEPDSRPKLLIVEDEARIANLLARGFAAEGFAPLVVSDGRHAIGAAAVVQPDAIILDLMLPGRDGLELLPDLCEQVPGVPVVILSARREAETKVAGLRAGAVDYVIKPFSFEELLERVKLRIGQAARVSDDLVIGHIRLDLRARAVDLGQGAQSLTSREFRLLELLMRNAGTPVSRERLTQEVWGTDYVSQTNIIDVTVMRLRQKIGKDHLVTVRGAGYLFEP
jgi:two-component system, OmpR family, copper resistance phosphate regulon response regulator CusR